MLTAQPIAMSVTRARAGAQPDGSRRLNSTTTKIVNEAWPTVNPIAVGAYAARNTPIGSSTHSSPSRPVTVMSMPLTTNPASVPTRAWTTVHPVPATFDRSAVMAPSATQNACERSPRRATATAMPRARAIRRPRCGTPRIRAAGARPAPTPARVTGERWRMGSAVRSCPRAARVDSTTARVALRDHSHGRRRHHGVGGRRGPRRCVGITQRHGHAPTQGAQVVAPGGVESLGRCGRLRRCRRAKSSPQRRRASADAAASDAWSPGTRPMSRPAESSWTQAI